MVRILVIDDDAAVRDSTAEILSAHGYSATSAPDGEQGLNLLAAEKFDVVITDVLMPGMDGIEVVRELRKVRSEVKIIAISGGSHGTDRFVDLRAAGALGADDILEKPFDEDRLIAAIQHLTGAPT
jgi:CheY-like chemotaxis protein